MKQPIWWRPVKLSNQVGKFPLEVLDPWKEQVDLICVQNITLKHISHKLIAYSTLTLPHFITSLSFVYYIVNMQSILYYQINLICYCKLSNFTASSDRTLSYRRHHPSDGGWWMTFIVIIARYHTPRTSYKGGWA